MVKANLKALNFIVINIAIIYVVLYNSIFFNQNKYLIWVIGLIIFSYIFVHTLIYKSLNFYSKTEIILFIFIIYMFSSFTWSSNGKLVLKESVLIVFVSLLAVFITRMITFNEFFYHLVIAYILITLASILNILFNSEFGIDKYGEWIGVFHHKNVLGINMAFFSVILLIAVKNSTKRTSKAIYFLFLLLAFLLLWNSKSSTALIVVVLSIFVLSVFFILKLKFSKRRFVYFQLFILIVVSTLSLIIFYFVINNLNSLLNILGKDATFTGRNYIWDIAINGILKHPIIGNGIRSYWFDYKSNSVNYYLPWGQGIWHSHNAFLELLLQFGVIGGVFFVILYTVNFCISLNKFVKSENIISYFSLICLLFLVISNLTETYLFGIEINFWFIFVCLTAYLTNSKLGK
ncbi:hypothetical protein B4114_2811 [Geobacillus stearothermophilus]|uniref:O-antigen ligase-related domain-containing protein n=1 Tax=Geobacillus stearothermophilus TaxID=1422 RepID=A0A150N425_GEOSE|nr:O-antigen ligase family protein [Geobacillus stearothermophilus]KYD31445.1 hypothetical protein B4114_2811 [Geobacillus stearothermophilus]